MSEVSEDFDESIIRNFTKIGTYFAYSIRNNN